MTPEPNVKRVPKVLVVDDEHNICQSCVKILSKQDYDVRYALNGYDALKLMEDDPSDVIVTDLKMSRLGGMELLSRVKDTYPDTRVVVITGYASVASAVEVMKMGAFDYLPKPFTPHELRAVVFQALSEKEMQRQNQELMSRPTPKRTTSHQLIGSSPKIQKVISMVGKVAPTDSTVLVYGESGTGKELIARAVHANSRRNTNVFFAVDCGTLAGNRLESELFGHVKGAFTSAHKSKEGILSLADSGTVFLDEISNISLAVQGKLLRFLETREFLPLGGTSPKKVDLRLIFATNTNLETMVNEGSFRQDFYYRIFVYPIMLPPLRERRMDILPIAYHFIKQFSRDMDKSITGIVDSAAGRLLSFDWPGNVRQLRNVIERAVILCDQDTIDTQDLPLLGEIGDLDNLVEATPATNAELKQVKKDIRRKAVQKVEKNFLLNALIKNDWNVTHAAEKTGLQRTNFQSLMKKHGIRLPNK
ncbi:MAG: sigma-54 dependent transcriptional regulator [Thermodesulfobacteriota bacterium]